jgi:hypothetical protein
MAPKCTKVTFSTFPETVQCLKDSEVLDPYQGSHCTAQDELELDPSLRAAHCRAETREL